MPETSLEMSLLVILLNRCPATCRKMKLPMAFAMSWTTGARRTMCGDKATCVLSPCRRCPRRQKSQKTPQKTYISPECWANISKHDLCHNDRDALGQEEHSQRARAASTGDMQHGDTKPTRKQKAQRNPLHMERLRDKTRGAMWVLGGRAQNLQLCWQHRSSPSQPWEIGDDQRSGPDPGLISLLWFPWCCTSGSCPEKFIQILSVLFDPPDSGSPSLQDTPSWRIFTGLCYGMSHKSPREQLALLMCVFNLSSILIYDNIDSTVPSQHPEGVRWLKIIHLTLN